MVPAHGTQPVSASPPYPEPRPQEPSPVTGGRSEPEPSPSHAPEPVPVNLEPSDFAPDQQAPPPTDPWSPSHDEPPAFGWSGPEPGPPQQQPPDWSAQSASVPPPPPAQPVQAGQQDAQGNVPGSSVVQAGPLAWTVEHHEGDRYALRNLGTVVAEGVTVAEVPGLVCEQLPRGVAIVPFAAHSFTARAATGVVRPSAVTVSWSGPEPGMLAVPFPQD